LATKTDKAAADLYGGLMAELKARAESINTAIGLTATIPAPLLREYGYLQLRMMCELVALGCLVAHGDIPATHAKSLQKAYDAADIFKALDALHPDFFPVPVKSRQVAGVFHLDKSDEPHLTKSDLVQLYGRCGDVLHKGSVRKLLKEKAAAFADFNDLIEWRKKLLDLLSMHQIMRLGGQFYFTVTLDINGATHTVIHETVQT